MPRCEALRSDVVRDAVGGVEGVDDQSQRRRPGLAQCQDVKCWTSAPGLFGRRHSYSADRYRELRQIGGGFWISVNLYARLRSDYCRAAASAPLPLLRHAKIHLVVVTDPAAFRRACSHRVG